jgi:hypothetical protein
MATSRKRSGQQTAGPSVCESHHRVQQHGGAGLEMLWPGLLAHVVAQAADARYKYHPGWADTGYHLRVVAGAGRQPARGQGEVARGRLHQRDDLGRKRDGLEACEVQRERATAEVTCALK